MSDRDPSEPRPDYLWDRSGDADEEIVRLERTLGVLRHRGTPPPLPARRPVRQSRPWPTRSGWLAAAAVLLLAAGGAWWTLARQRAWNIVAVSGVPSVEGRSLGSRGTVAKGDWVVTDGASRARVAVGSIGTVEIEPNTRVQVVAAGGREHRLALDRGTIHARIWAPPKFFYVDTRAAVAVDLGCAYTLQVDAEGAGLLRVTHGWVGFEREGRSTYVPEGAMCLTRADRGPGTPYYEDAPPGYGVALALVDFAPAGDPRRGGAFDRVIRDARRRDALTLWHLLTRGSAEERGRAYDRLAELVPPPDRVTREKILAGDREALNRWWDWLGIDVSTWWRLFKKKW